MSDALGITFEENDRAGVVMLDRPARLNALTREMFEALSAFVDGEHALSRLGARAPHLRCRDAVVAPDRVLERGRSQDIA